MGLIYHLFCSRLHHHAGSNPLELHGTVYTVVCLDCGFSFCRNLFQDQVKELNPKVSFEQLILPRVTTI